MRVVVVFFFFFFNDTAATEIYTEWIVGSVSCVYKTVLVMGARPGRILADIAVDAPYPRGRAFRESRTYMDTCAAVSAALREGVTS